MSTAAILNISEFKLLNQLRGVDYYKIALWSIGSGMDLNIQLSNNQRRRFLQIKIADCRLRKPLIFILKQIDVLRKVRKEYFFLIRSILYQKIRIETQNLITLN